MGLTIPADVGGSSGLDRWSQYLTEGCHSDVKTLVTFVQVPRRWGLNENGFGRKPAEFSFGNFS